MPWELPGFLDGEFVRKGWEKLGTLARLEETTAGISSGHLKIVALEMAWYMRNQILRDSDWASMAHGLEVRVPFVDTCLFERLAAHLALPSPPTKRDLSTVPKEWHPTGRTCAGEDRFQYADSRMDEGSHFFRWGERLPSVGTSCIRELQRSIIGSA